MLEEFLFLILIIILILMIIYINKKNHLEKKFSVPSASTKEIHSKELIVAPKEINFIGESTDLTKQLSLNVTDLLYPNNYTKPILNSITVQYSDSIQNAGETSGQSDKLIKLSKSWFNAHPDVSELKGVLIHELTHCFQYSANMPSYIVEGIADYARLYYNYIPVWWKKNKNDPYTQGYSTMAYFLQYIVTKHPTFVQDLNNESMTGYSDQIFIKLTGKSIDELFQEYKS